MNRSLKIVLSLLLLIGLTAIALAAVAQTDPLALQITDIKLSQGTDGLTFNATLENSGSSAIDEFGLALAFFDGNGDRFFGYANTLEGYDSEVAYWYYTPEKPINADGGTFRTTDVFADYTSASTVAVAVRYYHPVDGSYIMIPESDWQWQLPDFIEGSGNFVPSYYLSPPDSLYDTLGDYNPGYNYYLLAEYNATYYGKTEGGEWITNVDEGSPAALAGLQIGDLIISVDGVKPTENTYAVEYAMAKIVAGETVDWVYERDGVINTVNLGK